MANNNKRPREEDQEEDQEQTKRRHVAVVEEGKKMSYFAYQELMSTPRWIMEVLESGEHQETGVVQLLNSKNISGVGLMLKISDSEYSSFHCSPGNEEANNMLLKLEDFTIFQITKCSKEGTKILIEDIAVFDGEHPSKFSF